MRETEKEVTGTLVKQTAVIECDLMPERNEVTGNLAKPSDAIDGELCEPSDTLNGDIPGEVVIYIPDQDIPSYSGPYEVKPALESQTLETEGLLMRQDVTVEQIPIYIVSNNSGGDTVIIGG